MPDQNLPTAAWYPDPENAGTDRWWDGTSWSDHRRPQQTVPAFVPPSSGYPAAPAAPAFATTGVQAYPVGGPAPYVYAVPPRNNLALAGMIVSLASIIVNVFGIGSFVGAFISLAGLKRSRELAAQGYPQNGRGFAIAGIAVGFAYGALSLIFWIAYIAIIVGLVSQYGSYSSYSAA